MEKTNTYNLLEEHWIPVLRSNGTFERVGIRAALEEAGRIRQIAASNPMDRVAILRFLLALLYWCRGNPPDEGGAASGGAFPDHWFSKLDENREYFSLLGEGERFYQDRRAQRNRASTDLIQEIPTGNNFWHFRHSTDRADGLCVACCAMGLLRLPLFSVSGLPDLKSGINGAPPTYVVRLGMTLLDTLCANWTTRLQLGDPAWVKSDIRLVQGEPVPLLTGLTLLSRRVWLHEPAGPPGECVACGSRERALIRTCEFQTAGKQENDLWNDPHVVYLDKSPRRSSKAPDLTATAKFRMDRPWSGLLADIVAAGNFVNKGRPTGLLIVGFATDKAKNIDVWERTLELPSTESSEATAMSLLRQWGQEGRQMEKRLTRITRSTVQGAAAMAFIRPHVEHRVSAKAGDLVAGGDTALEEATDEYRPMMAVIAKSLSPGFTTEAVQRRKEIEAAAPNMLPVAKPTNKKRRKKGDKE